jgi:hypothetical protein
MSLQEIRWGLGIIWFRVGKSGEVL